MANEKISQLPIGGNIVPGSDVTVIVRGGVNYQAYISTNPSFQSITLTNNSNQIILGTGNTTTINSSGLTASRVLNLPDANSNPIQPASSIPNNWLTNIDAAGIQYFSQPNFTNISGTAQISQGGTSATTQQQAINNLTGTQTAGYYLRSDGINSLLSIINASEAYLGGLFTPQDSPIIANDNLAIVAEKTQGQINQIYPSVLSITSNYQINIGDQTIVVNASNLTITMPDATLAIPGRIYTIKLTNFINCTINTLNSQTIDGQSNINLAYSYDSIDIFSDSTQWLIK